MYSGNAVVVNVLMRFPILVPVAIALGTAVYVVAPTPVVPPVVITPPPPAIVPMPPASAPIVAPLVPLPPTKKLKN
jgi:hypothetical protein